MTQIEISFQTKKSDEYINKYIGQIEEIINAKQKKKMINAIKNIISNYNI